MAGSADGVRAGKAFIEIGAEDKGLQGILDRVAVKFTAIGSALQSVGTIIGGFGASITAPITAVAYTLAESGAAIYEMSKRTGASVAALSALGYAAEHTGTDLATVEGAFRRMQKTIGGVKDDVEGTTGKLGNLGIAMADIRGLEPEKQFDLIAEKLARITDPTKRATAAMGVFGKSGTMLLPMIEHLAEYQKEAKALGYIRTQQSAKEMKEFSVAMLDATKAMKGLWSALGSAVVPILKQKTAAITAVVLKIRDWARAHKPLADASLEPARLTTADVNSGWKPRPSPDFSYGADETFTWAVCYLNGERVAGIFPGGVDHIADPRTYEFAPGHAPWEIDPIDGTGDPAVDHAQYPLFEGIGDFDQIGFAPHDKCHDPSGTGPGSGSGSGSGDGSGTDSGSGTGGSGTGTGGTGTGTGGTGTGTGDPPTGPPSGTGTGGTGSGTGTGTGSGPCLPCAGYRILENADAMIVLSLTDADNGATYNRTFHLTLVGITSAGGQDIAYYRLGSGGFDAFFNCVTNEWVFAPGTISTPGGAHFIYNLIATGSGDSINGSATLTHEPAENENGSTADVSGTIHVTVGNTCEYGP